MLSTRRILVFGLILSSSLFGCTAKRRLSIESFADISVYLQDKVNLEFGLSDISFNERDGHSFDCYAANVVGDNIESADSKRFPKAPILSNLRAGSSCTYPGSTSFVVSEGESESRIKISAVPTGENRIIQLLGLQKGACNHLKDQKLSDIFKGSNSPEIELDSVYEIGRAQLNLTTHADIPIFKRFDIRRKQDFLAQCYNPMKGLWSSSCQEIKDASDSKLSQDEAPKSYRAFLGVYPGKLEIRLKLYSDAQCLRSGLHSELRILDALTSNAARFSKDPYISTQDVEVREVILNIASETSLKYFQNLGCSGVRELGQYSGIHLDDLCESKIFYSREMLLSATLERIQENSIRLKISSKEMWGTNLTLLLNKNKMNRVMDNRER